MLTYFQCILSDVNYTTATRDSLTARRRLSSPVSYVRARRTLCGVCTPLHQRGRAVRLDRPVRCGGRSTPCAGRATISVHSRTGRATARAMVEARSSPNVGKIKGVPTHGGRPYLRTLGGDAGSRVTGMCAFEIRGPLIRGAEPQVLRRAQHENLAI